MSPSVFSTNCSRFWLNKDSDHETKQQGSQATSAANDSLYGLVKPWGMRNDDTLIKCDEAIGQCVVAYSSLSVSYKTTTCPSVCRVKRTGRTLFVMRKSLRSASTAGRGGTPTPLAEAIKTTHHCSRSLRFIWLLISPSQQNTLVLGHIMLAVQTNNLKNKHTSANGQARASPLKADTMKYGKGMMSILWSRKPKLSQDERSWKILNQGNHCICAIF